MFYVSTFLKLFMNLRMAYFNIRRRSVKVDCGCVKLY